MKIILLLLLGLLGTALSQTCTSAYSKTYTSSVTPLSTDLLVKSLEARYDTFNVVWKRSLTNTLDVSVVVCSDTQSDVNAFNGNTFLSNAASGVVISLGGTTSLTTGTTSTNSSSSTSGGLTSSSTSGSGSGSGTTGPVAAGSTVAPNSLLYVVLASIFILPKKRFSVAVLLIAVVIFMASPETAIAAPTATTTVTVTISVPDSMLTFSVAGTNTTSFARNSNGGVTDYFSLFGRRFSSIDGLATECNSSIAYTVPTNWDLASPDTITKAAIAYGNYAKARYTYMVITKGGAGYAEGKFDVVLDYAQYTPKQIGNQPAYTVNSCDSKIAITQNFPIPESTDIAGLPQISNYITFAGYDYAVASNIPYTETEQVCPTRSQFSAYTDATTEWQVAANDDAAQIVISKSDGYVFGADCFTFADGSALSSRLVSDLCPNRGVTLFPFGSGNVYITANCGSLVIRRPSTKANTFATQIPITNFLDMITIKYAIMINAIPTDNTTPGTDCQPRFMSVPPGWRLTTPAELEDFVVNKNRVSAKWTTTWCWATSGASLYQTPTPTQNGTCTTVLERTVSGTTYYYPSTCANILMIATN